MQEGGGSECTRRECVCGGGGACIRGRGCEGGVEGWSDKGRIIGSFDVL